jgi:hypothetical protein
VLFRSEAQLIADHPDQKEIRGTIFYWNFLPPDELDNLLRLYAKVSKKTLRISKVLHERLRPGRCRAMLVRDCHAKESVFTVSRIFSLSGSYT